MFKSILVLSLLHLLYSVRLRAHQYDSTINHQQAENAQPKEQKIVAPVCKWLEKDLNQQKELTLNLASIYSMGKMPGQCNPVGISQKERQNFLRNAEEVKSKIVSTKQALLDSNDSKRKSAAKELSQFEQSFLNCYRILSPKTENQTSSTSTSQTPVIVPVVVPTIDADAEQAARREEERKKQQAQKQQQRKVLEQRIHRQQKAREQKDRLQNQRLQKLKIQQERINNQKANLQKNIAERREIQRIAKQKQQQERVAFQKAQQQRKQRYKLEQQRIAQQKANQLRLMRLKQEEEARQKLEEQKEDLENRLKIAKEKQRKILQAKRLQQQKQEQERQKQQLRLKQEARITLEKQMLVKEQEQKVKAAQRVRLIEAQKQAQQKQRLNKIAEEERIKKEASQPTIVEPIPVAMVPLNTSSAVNIQMPKQYVTNPLAKNIIIDNRDEISQRLKKNLDDNTKDYDACPIDRPFNDGEHCISCKQYFNMNTRECVSCPKDTKYDELTLKCVKSIYVANLNADNIWLKERTIDEWKTFEQRIRSTSPSTIVECPIDKPSSVNNQCVKCQGEYPLYDIVTSSCVKCPDNQTFNSKERKCVRNLQPTGDHYLINPSTYGLIIDTQSIQDFANDYKKLKQDSQKIYEQCPSNRPFFNGKQCIACLGKNSLFRISTKSCTQCDEGYKYVYQFRSCLATNQQ